MSWMYYLLEANLYLILFYALYYLVLRRETWYQYNRAYLLGSTGLAFVIPVVQLGFLKPFAAIELPSQLITQYSYVAAVKAAPVAQPGWSRDDILLAVYLLIVGCLLTGLAIKITKLLLLSRKGTARDFGKWKVIKTDMERGAFSFFNYLFLSADMAVSDTVITHELVHVRQKHSWDIIYLEIFKIVNWFNPVAYLVQRSIKELHEFIADEAITGSKEQIETYTDFLVANAYGTYEHQLTNNLFNQSLLKKRIMMLHQKRSGNTARLKYLLALPLAGGLLCASTLAFAKDYGWIDIAPRDASAKLVSPKSKMLKIISGGTTLITNKLSIHESDGGVTIYTGNSLSAADRDYLLKKHKMVVDIYVAGDLKKYKEVSNVNIYASGATEIAPKISKQTNPQGKPKKAKTLLYQSSQVPGKTTTPLIMINGRPYNLTEGLKPGQYLFATASDSIIQYSPGELSAMRKWGHDARNGAIELFGKSSVQVLDGAKDTTGKVIRKQTDSIINGRVNSTINGQINSTINKEIKKASSAAPDQKTSNKLPPPGWSAPAFGKLAEHIAKYTRYPAKEFEQKVVGNVIIKFTINNDHKIADPKVMNEAQPAFANECIRALKLYIDTINTAPATYLLAVQFNQSTEKMTKTYLPANLSPKVKNDPNLAAIVQLVGYMKE